MAALTPVHVQVATLLELHAAYPVRYPVLLESAAQSEPLGRYSILLAHPQAGLSWYSDGRRVATGDVPIEPTFLASLDAWWRRERGTDGRNTDNNTSPFLGGWFVYLGYELAGEIEPSVVLPSTELVAHARRIPAAIVVRHSDHAAWIVTESGSETLAADIASDIATVSLRPRAPLPPRILAGDLVEEPGDRYLRAVHAALDHIAAGDIYQANLSRRWHGALADAVQPHHVYRRLRQANPAPFAALAVLDELAIVSSSPERLIEIRDGVVATRPIAGTRPRRSNREDDDARRMELRAHPKERAEHVMLIDLERNDLGRICTAGSVEVNEYMTIESYEHVHHIVSNVRGRLRPGITPGGAIAAVFPGGTITGCPKVRCMQIIAELEGTTRGAYTGAMGYLNRDGSMDLNILIRTLQIADGTLWFRAGAGIVADSIAERELEETRAKARGLIHALVDPLVD